jgi:uncharacterized OB-fold protein
MIDVRRASLRALAIKRAVERGIRFQRNMSVPNMPPNEPILACPHLLHLDGDRPSLIGSRCTHCGEVYFPASRGCTRCLGTELEACDLGSEGILWSWTIQAFLPKPPYNSGETEADFAPYGVGYVEMPSGIKVESRLTIADPEKLSIGMPMALAVAPYGKTPEGAELLTFVFRPSGDSQ